MSENSKKLIDVHMFWAYGQLSKLEKLSLNSFIANDFNVILWSYDQIKNINPKATLKDAREIIPESKFFKTSYGDASAFSDIFRYKILNRFSGLYSDLDVIALKNASLLPQQSFIVTEKLKPSFFSAKNNLKALIKKCIYKQKKFFDIKIPNQIQFKNEKDTDTFYLNLIDTQSFVTRINGNVMFNVSPENGHIINLALLFSENFPMNCFNWCDCGPTYLNVLVRTYPKISPLIMDPNFSNPFHWSKCPELLIKRGIKLRDDTFFLHTYHSRWKTVGVDTNAPYPEGSIMDTLAKKYL